MANEIEKRNEAFLIYQDENGIARVNVRFEMTQGQVPITQERDRSWNWMIYACKFCEVKVTQILLEIIP